MLFLLLLSCSTAPVLSVATSCEATYNARLRLVSKLSAEEFEAENGQGWRPLAKAGCFKEAAGLLEAFSRVRGHHYSRSFHQARQWLSIDQPQKARPHLLASLRPELSANDRFKWNNYVLAHVAYVDQDFEKFSEEMSALEQDREFYPNKINLKILAKIKTDFTQRFSIIFEIRRNNN